jgi:mono/diheme cytochrome c family protein
MRCMRNKMLRVAMLAGGLAAISFVAPTAKAQSPAEKNYTKNCAACHGADGTANTPAGKATKAVDFHSAAVKSQTDEQLAAAIAKGKAPMAGYEKQLKPDEIKDLVTYVRTLASR